MRQKRPSDGQDKGAYGENIAVGFLHGKGCTILCTRYSSPHGEIDIIAMQDRTLVFAEVKLRRGVGAGSGASSVTKTKQKRIIKTALAYLSKEAPDYDTCRFDVLDIWGREFYQVRHIENAFYADGSL